MNARPEHRNKLTDRAQQLMLQARRRLPGRKLVGRPAGRA